MEPTTIDEYADLRGKYNYNVLAETLKEELDAAIRSGRIPHVELSCLAVTKNILRFGEIHVNATIWFDDKEYDDYLKAYTVKPKRREIPIFTSAAEYPKENEEMYVSFRALQEIGKFIRTLEYFLR